MKRKLLNVVLILTVIIGTTGCSLFGKNKTTTITMDINPSFKVTLEGDKVKDIVSLNDDAKEFIKEDLKGKQFKESLDLLVNDLIEHDVINENEVSVLINVEGSKDKNEIESVIKNTFNEHNVNATVIIPVITDSAKELAKQYNITEAKAAYIESVANKSDSLTADMFVNKSVNEHNVNATVIIPVITDSAKELAKQYNITEAKAAYIESVANKSDSLTADMFVNKSVNEIKNVKESGKYCDEGYTLDGDSCIKVIGEERPEEDSVCPEGTEEINGKCYKTKGFEETPYCEDGLTLKDGKCTGTKTVDASAKCSTGTYNSTTKKCEVLAYASAGSKTCKNADDLLLDNGKCAYAHMGAHFDDPEGEIDPTTECCCGDTWVANPSVPGRGWCYSMPDGNYDATITCPSGTTKATGDKGEGCYKATTSEPTYYCQGTGELDGNKCTGTVTETAKTKRTCSEDYKMYKDRVCVNYNETVNYINGYKCTSENSRLVGNVCKLLEIVEAKNY